MVPATDSERTGHHPSLWCGSHWRSPGFAALFQSDPHSLLPTVKHVHERACERRRAHRRVPGGLPPLPKAGCQAVLKSCYKLPAWRKSIQTKLGRVFSAWWTAYERGDAPVSTRQSPLTARARRSSRSPAPAPARCGSPARPRSAHRVGGGSPPGRATSAPFSPPAAR